MRIDGDQLRFGIHSGQQNATFDEYLAIWRLAEEVGLEWASVFDHFQPIQSDPTGPCFEGFTLLSAMAAHTSHGVDVQLQLAEVRPLPAGTAAPAGARASHPTAEAESARCAIGRRAGATS